MRKLVMVALVALALMTAAPTAQAVPLLQLDIIGGYYDTATQTVISNGPTFQLVVLLTPNGSEGGNPNQADDTDLATLLAETYYVSAALVPQTGPTDPLGGIGSFSFNGTTVNATTDMTYGVPPFDLVEGHPDAQLAPHDIFPTFYSEFDFQFNPVQRANTYNTADNAGDGPVPNPLGDSYYQLFTIDLSDLDGPYQLHFDLYDTIVKREAECRTRQGVTSCSQEDLDAGNFAPFSHDAESGGGPPPVPEPATLLLTLSGLGAAAFHRRRRGNQS